VPDAEPRDDDLLAAARVGSREAIEALLERYQKRVFAFGLRMCGDPEDAKDVLQETMLAAARGVEQFRGSSSLSTWLFSIARSFCIKKRRHGRFAPAEEVSLEGAASDLPADAPSPDDVASRREVRSAIAAALAELDPDLREVIVLRDIEGFTAPEVSTITGDSADAVKSRLHRARAAVRARLAAALGETPPPRGRDCPDVLAAFSKKLEGELDPKVCADLERHIEACPACRGICDSLKRTLAVCAGVAAGPVPEAVRRSVRAALRDALAGAP
jgi:RNA polymerase sigma-70 factor (ECF subfamily)